nr:lasso peptide biosynthesis B2 protein [Mariprofundus sp. KV]
MLRKCGTFLRMPIREKFWFFWIWLISGPIRAALLLLPFRKMAPMLGEHCSNLQLAAIASDEQKQQAWRIGRIVELAASYTPWESKCLVQACMASILLRRYGIPYVIHLGVTRGDGVQDALKAHAWLSVGPWIVTGRDGHRTFTIVSTFVSPGLFATIKDQEIAHAS